MNTIWYDWGDVFNQSLQDLWFGFVQFTPKFLIAVIFFVIGWLLGNVIARAVEQVFAALKIDNLFKSIGADDFLRRAGTRLNSGYFVGQVAKWFVIIVFLLPSLTLILGPNNEVAVFLKNDVLAFLPRVFIAAFVLIIAAVVSEGLSGAMVATARTMNLRAANFFGSLAKYAIWVFALIIALGKLGLGDYMEDLFSALVYMIALAIALAFGLGGRDAAARFISRLGEEVSHNNHNN